MDFQIKSYHFPDGTLQRVQWVRLPEWERLEFLQPEGSDDALDCFASIYRQYLIPACPWLFGNLVLFRLKEGMKLPLSRDTGRHGTVAGELSAAAAALSRGVRLFGGKPRFRDKETEALWNMLSSADCIRIVRGRLPTTAIIPVGNGPGFLSRCCPGAAVRTNASFFIMDPFDCATVYDHVGTCLGLLVKDGAVTNPPLYGREALLVRQDGCVEVKSLDIRDLSIKIGDTLYRHGRNCRIYTRPRHSRVRAKGRKLVIVGDHVEAVRERGPVMVPASGYVLCPWEGAAVRPGEKVCYKGLEDVIFGIQVGNSILRDGEKTTCFRSKFYNIRHLEPVPYPPSLYPMDFHASRAARMALGADSRGKPVLLWAEGAPKIGYVPGRHSRGASLEDMGNFCADAGMVHAVNLDGGGSAQLLASDTRVLEISDRNPDASQSERPVPNGLVVK